MSPDEFDAAEARLAELKRRAAAGELTDEEMREMKALERKLAVHYDAVRREGGVMNPAELNAAEARLAELKRRAAAGELTAEEMREMEALERKLAVHKAAAKAQGMMSADEVDAAEARLAELKRRAAAGELTAEEKREMEALERKLAAHQAAAKAQGLMSADEVDAAEARLAELKRRAAAGELTAEEKQEMEALERKLAAHQAAAKAQGMMSADEVNAAEARLAELKRRAAAGELTAEEKREMEALERKLAAHNAVAQRFGFTGPDANADTTEAGGRSKAKGTDGKGDSDDEEDTDDPAVLEERRRKLLLVDWAAISSALPAGNDPESIRRRAELFLQWDVNGNKALSYSEVDSAMRKLMREVTGKLLESKAHHWSKSWKPVIMRAFDHAKDSNKNARKAAGKKRQSDYIEPDEFRLLLACMRQYFEFYIAFSRMDYSSDRKISLEEFIRSLPELASWGIDVKEEEAEAEFKVIDENGGGSIMFDEFVKWAIDRHLDLEDDDDHDELEKMEAEWKGMGVETEPVPDPS